MFKKILNSEATKEVAREAIATISGIVAKTLGPGGNPIIIQREGQSPDGTPIGPLVTKDGVTVAEHVDIRDPAINTLVKAVLEVAQKTVEVVGDGSSTSLILANAIYQEGSKLISQGTNGIQLFNDLNEIKNVIVEQLNKLKKNISENDVLNVARISANGEEEVAQIVFDALKAVGEDGYVSLEDGNAATTKLEIVEGAVYKRGWRNFAPNGILMVNDKARNICELTNPAILLFAGKLENVQDLEKLLASVWKFEEQSGTYTDIVPLLIVAHDFSDDFKNRILQIRVQGKLPIAAIKSPADGSPNARTEMLEDLAVMLGASVFSNGILELSMLKDEHLGNAERVEISAEETVFFGGAGSKEAIMQRIDDINQLIESGTLHPFDAQNARFRKGKLSGGIAIVRVGAKSELEMLEKKDRIEDALCAAKVAIQDGILPGGGYTLYKLSKSLRKLVRKKDTIALTIMEKALQAPIKQIITNIGENPDIILTKMPKNKGYDARSRKYADLMKAGIVDPAKVTKAALENAVSIAGLLLTTGGALVSDLESEDGKNNPLAGLLG